MTPLMVLASRAGDVLGRQLDHTELGYFENYLALLLKWQKAHRLVGSDDAMWIVEHLILDSLLYLKVLPSHLRTLADLGSGAGLPGLPIKIVRPEIGVVLIESRRRRAMFLRDAVRTMKLESVRVIEGRAESIENDWRDAFDAVVMRCAGDVAVMIPIAVKLVSDGGVVVASGPPEARPLALGQWVTVPGVRPGTSRRFATYIKRARL